MGVGKSTFIKENKLEDFVLSFDELRIKMAGFDMSENGLVISSRKDRQVWQILYTMLETRMEMGLFTVVDAMHLHTRDFKKYKELADLYGYKIYVKRFDDISLEELLDRNTKRETYKQIPTDVIVKKYEIFTNQVLPDYVTVINSVDELMPKAEKLDKWDRIYCVGDIHNNADKLEIIYNEIKEEQNSLYIFTGDIFDRGSKPYETMLLVGKLLELDNVRFIQGNHERHVRNYVYGTDKYSNQFKTTTLDKILERTQDTSILANLTDRLEEFLHSWVISGYEYGGEDGYGLQFSINTLDNEQRNKMFNNQSLSLEEISELIKKLPSPKKRKFTLNFAVTGENDLDVAKMNKLFDKERCIVKITSIHETVEAVKNGYEIVHTFDVYEKYEKPLVAAGWDVIVFVPSLEEDEDRITCGNSLIALENSKKKEN